MFKQVLIVTNLRLLHHLSQTMKIAVITLVKLFFQDSAFHNFTPSLLSLKLPTSSSVILKKLTLNHEPVLHLVMTIGIVLNAACVDSRWTGQRS